MITDGILENIKYYLGLDSSLLTYTEIENNEALLTGINEEGIFQYKGSLKEMNDLFIKMYKLNTMMTLHVKNITTWLFKVVHYSSEKFFTNESIPLSKLLHFLHVNELHTIANELPTNLISGLPSIREYTPHTATSRLVELPYFLELPIGFVYVINKIWNNYKLEFFKSEQEIKVESSNALVIDARTKELKILKL